MTQTTIRKIFAIGAATGIRSMAGVAALSLARDSRIMPALALGEMLMDKTPLVGDRVAPLPLAGRALMGMVAGVIIAREQRESVVMSGLLGAASAIVVTHLAYQARNRLPVTTVAGGLVEDAIVLAIVAPNASFRRRATGVSTQAPQSRRDAIEPLATRV